MTGISSTEETAKGTPKDAVLDGASSANVGDDKNTAKEGAKSTAKEGKDTKINWFVEIRGLVFMLLGVLAFHSLVAKPFYIPSISMAPTLLVGDRLIVTKYPYGWSWVSTSFHLAPRSDWRINPSTPEYGDIVVPVPPTRDEDYIKRVIGLPGDTIALVNGQIILNGIPIVQEDEVPVRIPADNQHVCENNNPCLMSFEAYRVTLDDGSQVFEPPTYRETLPNGATYLIIDHLDQRLDNYPETLIPEGHVFLMGDNRDHSADSRASAASRGLGGPVPLENVGGRAEIITFSLDGQASWNPISWFTALRGDRAWTSLRPELRTNGEDSAQAPVQNEAPNEPVNEAIGDGQD